MVLFFLLCCKKCISNYKYVNTIMSYYQMKIKNVKELAFERILSLKKKIAGRSKKLL